MSRGNSLLVVEHDAETIEQADYIIDVGPEAGSNGGKIMACGDKIMALQEESSAYLSSGNLDYNFTRMKAPKGIKTRGTPIG